MSKPITPPRKPTVVFKYITRSITTDPQGFALYRIMSVTGESREVELKQVDMAGMMTKVEGLANLNLRGDDGVRVLHVFIMVDKEGQFYILSRGVN